VLGELRVENLGIIDEVDLVLGGHMTAITGETGAGKTLLVEALDLLLGGRADGGLVRPGAEEARVEGRFVVDDDEVVLARVVPKQGRSRAYLDGRLATAGELAARGRTLVDLHGQHEHQSLLVPAEQRALLDRFAGDEATRARADVGAARAELRDLDAQLARLGGDDRTRAREADLLRFQLAEIDAAALEDLDEDTRLAGEEALLGDAAAHAEALDAAFAHLDGPAVDGLGAAIAELAGRAPFAGAEDRLRRLQAELAEVAHDLRVEGERVVVDPDRLAVVRARRRVLSDLRRKFGDTLAEVVAYRDDVRARLAALEEHESRAARLGERRDVVGSTLSAANARLGAARREAAGPLAVAVTGHLAELAMPGARLEVAVEPGTPGEDGADDVTLLLAANPGEAARPLARAASGGELSRAMLAVRVVLSEAPPTLVFDEVDAGIGGEAGVAVGRALASLGGKHQVLCVTHLAQVAAFADEQVVVRKHRAGSRTVAGAEVVAGDRRVAELARMLAGVVDSAHAHRHAQELLAAAAVTRAEVR